MPCGSFSSSRCSSSAIPAVNSTAPAAISGARCAGGRSSSSRSSRRAMRRATLRGQPLLGLSGALSSISAVAHAHLPGAAAGRRPGRARRCRRPSLKTRAVPGAGDAAVGELALVERAAAVRAAVGERVDLAAGARQQDADAPDLGVARLALGQLGVAQRRRPVLRRRPRTRSGRRRRPRRSQVPAEVAAQRRARPRRPARAACPCRARRRGGRRARRRTARSPRRWRRVDDADAAHGVVADLGVRPLGQAGRGGGRGEGDAQPDQPVRGRPRTARRRASRAAPRSSRCRSAGR